MDDAILKEQYALTGNIMDVCSNPEWPQEGIRVEDECDGFVEAGLAMGGYVEALKRLSPEQKKNVVQYAKLIHILFPELHRWVESWNLSAGFEAAHEAARTVLMERWETFAIEQEEWVKALIAEDELIEASEGKPVRAETRTKLAQFFTDDDWQKIADGAAQAVKQNVLQVGQVILSEQETAKAA